MPVLFISAYLFLAVTHDAQTPPMHFVFQLWLFGVVGAYFCYCWVRSGQTLAMKTWRLRVERRHGGPLSVRQAALRYVVAAIGLFLVGITFWWAFVDRQRFFLHDRLAGTRIVRVIAPAPGPSGAPVDRAA